MSHHTDDDEASLAVARFLQAQYDQLASSSYSQQESPLEAEYRAAARRNTAPSASSKSGSISSPNEWKNTARKENGPKPLEAEHEVTSPWMMSDEEYARLLQMEEDANDYAFSSSPGSSAPARAPSNDPKGKRVSSVPFNPFGLTGPPSPPIS